MIPVLEDAEIRVLGTLMEKAVITPEQYPLTLNALTLACNQKTSRDPVTHYTQVEVQRTARDLEAKSLLKRDENFRSGVEKYEQRFCNTPFAGVKLDAQEYGVLTVLLLRGAQTPGELRARVGRLCSFDDNDAVADVLQRLIDREGGALVARLPRRAGRQDNEYVHTLAADAPATSAARADTERAAGDEAHERHTRVAPAQLEAENDRVAQLEARIDSLEAMIAELRKQLGS